MVLKRGVLNPHRLPAARRLTSCPDYSPRGNLRRGGGGGGGRRRAAREDLHRRQGRARVLREQVRGRGHNGAVASMLLSSEFPVVCRRRMLPAAVPPPPQQSSSKHEPETGSEQR